MSEHTCLPAVTRWVGEGQGRGGEPEMLAPYQERPLAAFPMESLTTQTPLPMIVKVTRKSWAESSPSGISSSTERLLRRQLRIRLTNTPSPPLVQGTA